MLNFLNQFFDQSKGQINKVKPIVKKINELEPEFSNKSDDELRELIATVKAELKVLVDEIEPQYKISLKAPNKDKSYVSKEEKVKQALLNRLPEVYAAVRESLKRNVGYSHYDVQLIASSLLAQGYKLTELKTGEGKTLVFQLPAALYGLSGRGAHVITVNDYLAKRDGEYAGYILNYLGITVGINTSEGTYKYVSNEDAIKFKGDSIREAVESQNIKNPGDCDGLNLIECSKKEAYACDVVYGTNNEFGFDYLRDNMTNKTEDIVQRELYFCIVDEADSILIDEARTPLIISAQAEASNELYTRFASLVPKLKKEDDYTVDEKSHSVSLTDDGAEKMEKLLGVENIWQDYKLAHHLENALKAQELYKKDSHYLVRNNEVFIVDQFTGRVLEGRRYSEGLHQAIEAKEGVEIKRESKTLGTITFQNFFRLYKILSGGSGTVMTESEEFYKIYNLESIEVPTNKPVIRQDYVDRVYKNKLVKFKAVAQEVAEIHESGQPVLVGTSSIDDSEVVSKFLKSIGVKHEVLNAKFHEKESKIVANAGKRGSVTVATNMAGRGTDIKLGGKNCTKEESDEIMGLGGLAVIGTQRHDSRRVDNQLRGRSGRQGEPGMSRFYVSLDDDIMRIQGGDFVKRVMEMANLPEEMPIEAGLVGRSIESAQKRMEGMHFDSRKSVVDYDDVVNQQREIFYSRRRRILDSIEKLEGSVNDKLKDIPAEEQKDNPEIIEIVENSEIVNSIRETLNTEVDVIVNSHYDFSKKANADHTEDATKVVEDFLDLAADELLMKNSKLKSDDAKAFKTDLVEDIKDKAPEEIKSELGEIITKSFAEKLQEFGKEVSVVSKLLFLRSMDTLWTDHLEEMKALRDGIGLRGIAQQDPLVEYKNEGINIFDRFINSIDSGVARRVLKLRRVERVVQSQQQIQTNQAQVKDVTTGTRELERNAEAAKNAGKGPAKPKVNRLAGIGRNDKVTVEYTDGSVKKDVKFKKVENDVKAGMARVVMGK